MILNFFNRQNLEKYRNHTNKWITKNWIILHILFILFYSLYIILKLSNKKVFPHDGPELISSFTLTWFITDTIGFILLAAVFISGIRFKLWQYISIILVGFILIKISYVKTVDADLKWPGSDIAIGNYISAEEVVKFGVFDLLRTWNERTNPYSYKDVNGEIKDSIRYLINRYNLSGLTFDKWKTEIDSTQYNLVINNRPYMHPPLTPIMMGLWLNAFPFGRWSMELLTWFISFLSILLVILYSYKKSPGNLNSIVLISFTTSLVMYRFYSPSADQLGMFLFTVPIIILLFLPSIKFRTSFLFGIIYGLCFYTKFNVLSFILVLIVSLLLYSKRITFKPFLGLIIGFLIPVIIFTSLGYYFWLTLITGQAITKWYAINNPVNFPENISKLLYFGPSFLLLFLLLIINSNRIEKKAYPYFIPVIISLFILIIFLYRFGDWNRYLIQFMPAILLFLLSMDKIIELKKRDLLVSLLANFIFLNLNIYF